MSASSREKERERQNGSLKRRRANVDSSATSVGVFASDDARERSLVLSLVFLLFDLFYFLSYSKFEKTPFEKSISYINSFLWSLKREIYSRDYAPRISRFLFRRR